MSAVLAISGFLAFPALPLVGTLRLRLREREAGDWTNYDSADWAWPPRWWGSVGVVLAHPWRRTIYRSDAPETLNGGSSCCPKHC